MDPGSDERSATAFLARAAVAVPGATVRFRLHAADLPLVVEGDVVVPGTPLLERCREVSVVEVPHRGELAALRPGDTADGDAVRAGAFGGRRLAEEGDLVRVLSLTPDGRAQVAIGRAPEVVASPLTGVVEIGRAHV